MIVKLLISLRLFFFSNKLPHPKVSSKRKWSHPGLSYSSENQRVGLHRRFSLWRALEGWGRRAGGGGLARVTLLPGSATY